MIYWSQNHCITQWQLCLFCWCDTIWLQNSVGLFKAAVHVCIIRANTQKSVASVVIWHLPAATEDKRKCWSNSPSLYIKDRLIWKLASVRLLLRPTIKVPETLEVIFTTVTKEELICSWLLILGLQLLLSVEKRQCRHCSSGSGQDTASLKKRGDCCIWVGRLPQKLLNFTRSCSNNHVPELIRVECKPLVRRHGRNANDTERNNFTPNECVDPSTVVSREYRILGFEEVPSSSPGCHQCGNAVHIWDEEMLTL